VRDLVERQAAIDALDMLCQENRYRIPGKRETYSPYNEAWQDALDRAEGAIGNLPSAQPEKVKCEKCRYVYYDKEFGNYWCNRMLGTFMVEKDGYCKWGK